LIVSSCKKYDLQNDIEPEFEIPKNNSPFLTRNNWNSSEIEFFRLQRSQQDIETRSLYPYRYHQLTIEVYNELVTLNDASHFVESIVSHAGLPNWEKSYIYHDSSSVDELLILPFYFVQDKRTTSVLSVLKRGNDYYFDVITRDEAFTYALEGDSIYHDFVQAAVFKSFDRSLFGQSDPRLDDIVCQTYSNSKLPNSPEEAAQLTTSGPLECEWSIIVVCSDDFYQLTWFGGVMNMPPNIDHDHDGIPNYLDQDWEEFYQHTNIDQAEFDEIIEDWWNTNYEEEFGDYEEFWNFGVLPYDDVYDAEGILIDFEDLEDAWEEFQEYINSLDDDQNSNGGTPPQVDIFGEEDGYCYDDHPVVGQGGGVSRDVRCEYYYVLDCPDGGQNGDNWYDEFSDIVPCPSCDGTVNTNYQNQQIFLNYMYNMNLENVPGLQQYLATAMGNPNFPTASPGFVVEQWFSNQVIDYFLQLNPDITIDPVDEQFILSHLYNLALMFEIDQNYPIIDLNYAISVLQYGENDFSLQDFINNYDMITYLDQLQNNITPVPEPEEPEETYPNVIVNWSTTNIAPYSGLPAVHLFTTPLRHPNNEDLQHDLNGDLSGVNDVSGFPLGFGIDNSEENCLGSMVHLFDVMNAASVNASDISDDFILEFMTGTSGFHNNLLLNSKVNVHNAYLSNLNFVAKRFNDKLSFFDGDMNAVDFDEADAIQFNTYRPKFNSQLDKTNGLKILINDTENYGVRVFDYSYNENNQTWQATFEINISDNFGLDKNDVLLFQNEHEGFVAWYRLQYQYDNVPFRNIMTFVFSAQGTLTP
jgi:Protein of unknown function (DUF3289)